jgi:hypothetical protein
VTSQLSVTLDQINANSYDGKRLAEVVATLPLGTPSGIDALISYDGAIAIPQCEDFPSKVDGVAKLNEVLCSLLLGGIHAEVLHSDGLVVGSLQDKAAFRVYPMRSCTAQIELGRTIGTPTAFDASEGVDGGCNPGSIRSGPTGHWGDPKLFVVLSLERLHGDGLSEQ